MPGSVSDERLSSSHCSFLKNYTKVHGTERSSHGGGEPLGGISLSNHSSTWCLEFPDGSCRQRRSTGLFHSSATACRAFCSTTRECACLKPGMGDRACGALLPDCPAASKRNESLDLHFSASPHARAVCHHRYPSIRSTPEDGAIAEQPRPQRPAMVDRPAGAKRTKPTRLAASRLDEGYLGGTPSKICACISCAMIYCAFRVADRNPGNRGVRFSDTVDRPAVSRKFFTIGSVAAGNWLRCFRRRPWPGPGADCHALR